MTQLPPPAVALALCPGSYAWAMVQVERGKTIRRKAWTSDNAHVRKHNKVIRYYRRGLLVEKWKPFGLDILADDYYVVD